jgi:hypothetical protein
MEKSIFGTRVLAWCFATTLLVSGVACASPISSFVDDQSSPSPLTPPPLPRPGTAARVGGAALTHIFHQNERGVRLSFRIPTVLFGLASENINQRSIIAGLTQTVSTVLTFANRFSDEFAQDVVLKHSSGAQIVVPPRQPGKSVGNLDVSVALESKSAKGVSWRTSTLTEANGNPIATRVFKAQSSSHLNLHLHIHLRMAAPRICWSKAFCW